MSFGFCLGSDVCYHLVAKVKTSLISHLKCLALMENSF